MTFPVHPQGDELAIDGWCALEGHQDLALVSAPDSGGGEIRLGGGQPSVAGLPDESISLLMDAFVRIEL